MAEQPEPQRICQFTRLHPQKREQYLALHAAVWPEIESRLHEANIENYSIFISGNTLISYYEYRGTDLDGDRARLAEDPVNQRWWALTDPCQIDPQPLQAGGPWRDLVEVWHLGTAVIPTAPSAGPGSGVR